MEPGFALTLELVFLFTWTAAGRAAISQSWRPIVPAQLSTSILHTAGPRNYQYNLHEDEQSQLISTDINRDECALYKVLMSQQLYFEYIHYKFDMPDLKEFTLCMWTKFTNHTNDHPLFSYAVGNQPRSILSWIANTQRSSYYMMNVDGHNLYRLNYPLRLNRWYHSCQSWNGRTGEWQIWVNDERVGRGFNNRLVGHVIKGGGIAISGQEQHQLGGGFLEGEEAPAGSGGMLGELTMVQLYGVALTAGKAHRDHKHHHAHHFEHDINNNVPLTTTTQVSVTGPPLPMNPFLTGGQLNHQVKINPGVHIQIIQNGVTLRHPSLPAPAEASQPLPPAILRPAQSTLGSIPQASLTYNLAKMLKGFFLPTPIDSPPVNGFSFVDRRYRDVLSGNTNTLNDNKYEEASQEVQKMAEQIELKKITKRESQAEEMNSHKVNFVDSEVMLRRPRSNIETPVDKKKRDLVFADGSIIDDPSYVPQMAQLLTDVGASSYLAGLASFGLATKLKQPPENKKDEREPAEDEVRRVMNICDGCADEPFEKALVMSWRNVPKKLYSGALHLPAVQACKAF